MIKDSDYFYILPYDKEDWYLKEIAEGLSCSFIEGTLRFKLSDAHKFKKNNIPYSIIGNIESLNSGHVSKSKTVYEDKTLYYFKDMTPIFKLPTKKEKESDEDLIGYKILHKDVVGGKVIDNHKSSLDYYNNLLNDKLYYTKELTRIKYDTSLYKALMFKLYNEYNIPIYKGIVTKITDSITTIQSSFNTNKVLININDKLYNDVFINKNNFYVKNIEDFKLGEIVYITPLLEPKYETNRLIGTENWRL